MQKIDIPTGRAICYSGYREGQSPDSRIYPSLEQIHEDLLILKPHWPLLRLYDCSTHAERVLEVIRRERMDFKVMLGAYLGPEMNNFGCPWGGVYGEEELEASIAANEVEVGRLIALAQAYEDIVFSVAVGNECTVDWSDHIVPVERMLHHVRRVKAAVRQPVTFCENYVPWLGALDPLADVVDEIGAGGLQGTGRQLQNTFGRKHHPANPHRFHGMNDVDHSVLAIDKDGIKQKPHANGMDGGARRNPQPFTRRQAGLGQQAKQPGQKGIGFSNAVTQLGVFTLVGTVKKVGHQHPQGPEQTQLCLF